MNKLKQGCLIAMSFMAFSCNQDGVPKCSTAYEESYQKLGDNFEKAYAPIVTQEVKDQLLGEINNFLTQFKDVECKLGETKVNATADVTNLKAALEVSNVKIQSNASEKAIPKVIYGEDNRKEASEVTPLFQNYASSTLVQMDPLAINDQFQFVGKTLKEDRTLCPGQRFENQLSVGRCSGFLVGPDIVITAGHCVEDQADCDQYHWVFDFKDDARQTSADKIYHCQEILSQALDSTKKLDFAVIRLDRKVEDRKFFRMRTSGVVTKGSSLVLIGYPGGISVKIADQGVVRDNGSKNYFVTNLDAFGGNSGSVVLNESTGVVEGVLVRGQDDYVVTDGPDGQRCRVVNVFSQNGGEGEEVTKMTSVTGIPLFAEANLIKSGVFENKTYPLLNDGQLIPTLGVSQGDYTLGGFKFLDRCGIHYYKNTMAQSWLSSFKGSCANSSIDHVITEFGNLFYF